MKLTESLNATRNEALIKANATHSAIQALNAQATQEMLAALAADAVAEAKRK